MSDFSRRDVVKIGVGLAAGTALGGGAMAQQAPEWKIQPEKGASLRVMRPAKFVQGDETLFLENTAKYEKATGVKVRVDSEGWEDLVPKSAVAANVGKGPDVVYGWHDNAHQFPDKLANLNDVANYLGAKYGGWYDLAQKPAAASWLLRQTILAPEAPSGIEIQLLPRLPYFWARSYQPPYLAPR